HVHEQARAFGAAGDVLEHHARPVLGAQHRFGGEPDVLLAIGALDGAHLAQSLRHREPFAQIVVGDIPGEVALAVHRATSLPSVHETADCTEPISRIPYHALIAVIDAPG